MDTVRLWLTHAGTTPRSTPSSTEPISSGSSGRYRGARAGRLSVLSLGVPHGGTDMTNSFAKASYRQRVTHFTEELSFLSESDKDWLMGRAILARLKWA